MRQKKTDRNLKAIVSMLQEPMQKLANMHELMEISTKKWLTIKKRQMDMQEEKIKRQ